MRFKDGAATGALSNMSRGLGAALVSVGLTVGAVCSSAIAGGVWSSAGGKLPAYADGTSGLPAQAITPANCPQIIFYGVRGSNEAMGTPIQTQPNGPGADIPTGEDGLGTRLDPAYQALKAALPGTSIGVESAAYPAILGLGSLSGYGAGYRSSMGQGVTDAVADLDALNAACSSSIIVAAGYSQGADVIRRALNPDVALQEGTSTPYPRLDFTPSPSKDFLLLYGDPDYDNQTGAIYTGGFSSSISGIGVAAAAIGLVPGIPPMPSGWHVEDFCHANDIVCQFALSSSTTTHYTYNLDATDAAWRIVQALGLVSPSQDVVTARLGRVYCPSPLNDHLVVSLTNNSSVLGGPVTFVANFQDQMGQAQPPVTVTVPAGETLSWDIPFPSIWTASVQIDAGPAGASPVQLESQALSLEC